MGTFFWALLVLALLVAAYFARPVYDFIWVAAGRVADQVASRSGKSLARRDLTAEIDSVFAQGAEVAAYLDAQRDTRREHAPATRMDYSSLAAYLHSTGPWRSRLQQSLGYPPPDFDRATATDPVQDIDAGSDEIAVYRELRIPALPGVQIVGLYVRPKSARPTDKLPLVIAAHGRDGEPAPTADGKLPLILKSNRDLAFEALKHGYAVWMPRFVHYAKDDPRFRDRLTMRAWEAGTSLPAIEIAKLVKAIDVLAARPDIDADRIAMMGLSYGGFYTLYTTALDPRIKVAVVAAYFNDRAAVLDAGEPQGFLDWRFNASLSLWRDPDVAALVAPRPLLILAGRQDQIFPIAGARRTAPEVAKIYERLGVPANFQFHEFVGRHDFAGAQAIAFIDEQFARIPAAAPAR